MMQSCSPVRVVRDMKRFKTESRTHACVAAAADPLAQHVLVSPARPRALRRRRSAGLVGLARGHQDLEGVHA